METGILTLVMDVLPKGVWTNDCDVLMGHPEVFKYEGKRILFKVHALHHQGFWIGDFWVMGHQWGYAGPSSLTWSVRFNSLPELIESEFPNFFAHLKSNEQMDVKANFLKYYNEWLSTVI